MSSGPFRVSPCAIAARSSVGQLPDAAPLAATGSAWSAPSPPEVPLASTLSASRMIGASASE